MTDTLATVAVGTVGSTVWFCLQVLAWSLGLGRFGSYHDARRLVIGALIAFPVFVLLVQCIRFLLGFSNSIGEFILMPLVTAWFLWLSWGGLRVAAHLRGLPLPPSPTPNAEPDGPANGSQPIRSETNRTSSAAGSRR